MCYNKDAKELDFYPASLGQNSADTSLCDSVEIDEDLNIDIDRS